MSTKNLVEIFLKLNVDALKQGANTAKSTVANMGSAIEGTLRRGNALWRAGGNAVDAYNNKLRQMQGTAGELKSTIGQVLGLIGGGMLFTVAGRSTVDFNSTVEQSRIGLAALVRTFNDLPNSTNVYADSMDIAAGIQRNLQIEGLKTVATYKQLLVALQEGLGPAFKQGFDPRQVVEFTSLMVQTAGAISLPMDQLGQEIRSILDGTIDRNSRVAKSLGMTNEKVKEMAASGKLFDYLKGKLTEFGQAGEDMAKTWTGAWSNLMDATQMGLGKGLEGSYHALTKLFLGLRDVIVDIDETAGTFSFNEKISSAIERADEAITGFIENITDEQLESYLVIIAETGAAVVDMLVLFLKMMKSLADSLGSSLPTIAKWTAAFILFGGALKVLIGLPMLVVKQLLAMNAAFAAVSGGSILLYIKHVQQASQHTGLLKTVFASVPNALATAGALMAAAFIGWQIGTWLYEQSDIVKKAGNRIAYTFTWIALQAKKAWAWIAGGDTAAVQREIDQAGEIYRQMFDDIGKGAKEAGDSHKLVATAAKESAAMQAKAQKSATDQMKKAYKKYADTVKKLQDDVAGREHSLAEQLREMDRSGMSEANAWKDRRAQAEEFAKSARKAEEAAKAAFEAGDTATGEAKYKEAVEYYDKAKDAAAELNIEISAGDRVIQTQGQSLKIAKGLVEEYGKAGIAAEKSYTEAIKQTAAALNEQSGGSLAKELPEVAKAFGDLTEQAEDLAQKSADFNAAWNDTWDEFLKDGKASITDLETRLNQLTKDRQIKVYVKEVEQRASGGAIGALRMVTGGAVETVRNMLSGGHFPGFGGGDRRHVVAEDGEYMLDKFRVRDAGLGVVRAFHAGRYDVVVSELMKKMKGTVSRKVGGIINRIPSLPPIGPQFLQAGGAVSVQGATSGDTYNFHFPANTPTANRQNAREQVNMFMSEMKRRYKGASK